MGSHASLGTFIQSNESRKYIFTIDTFIQLNEVENNYLQYMVQRELRETIQTRQVY